MKEVKSTSRREYEHTLECGLTIRLRHTVTADGASELYGRVADNDGNQQGDILWDSRQNRLVVTAQPPLASDPGNLKEYLGAAAECFTQITATAKEG